MMRGRLWVFLVFILGAVFLLPTASSERYPELATIIRQHEVLRDRMKTGRIQYIRDISTSPAVLERLKAREKQVLTNKIEELEKADPNDRTAQHLLQRLREDLEVSDQIATVDHLRQVGTYETRFVFDRERNSYIADIHDTRDLPSLIAQHGFGERGRASLPERLTRSLVDGREVKYHSAMNMLVFDAGQHYRLRAQKVLTFGLLRRGLVSRGSDCSVGRSDERPDMVLCEVVSEGRRVEAFLDPAIGFRWRQYRVYRDGRLVEQRRCEYRMCDDHIFPSEYVAEVFNEAGELLRTEEYDFTAVELNVPIEAGEFEVHYPPDARVVDKIGGRVLAGAAEVAREDIQGIGGDQAISVDQLGEGLLENAAAAELQDTESTAETPAFSSDRIPAGPFSHQDQKTHSSPSEREAMSANAWVALLILCGLVCAAMCIIWKRHRRAS